MSLKVRTTHCFKCGGTGKVYDDVPGSLIKNNPGWSLMTDVHQPHSRECSNCEGSGHITTIKEE